MPVLEDEKGSHADVVSIEQSYYTANRVSLQSLLAQCNWSLLRSLHPIPICLPDSAGLRADDADEFFVVIAQESPQLLDIAHAQIGQSPRRIMLESVDVEDHGIGFFFEEAIAAFALDIARAAAGAQSLPSQRGVGAFDDHGGGGCAAMIGHADFAALVLEVNIALFNDTARQLLIVGNQVDPQQKEMPHGAADAAFDRDGYLVKARVGGDAIDFFQRRNRHAIGGAGALPAAAMPEEQAIGAHRRGDQLQALPFVADLPNK